MPERFDIPLGTPTNNEADDMRWQPREIGPIPAEALAAGTTGVQLQNLRIRIPVPALRTNQGTNIDINLLGTTPATELEPEYEMSTEMMRIYVPGATIDDLLLPGPNADGLFEPDAFEAYGYEAALSRTTDIEQWVATFRALSTDDQNSARIEFRNQAAVDVDNTPPIAFSASATAGFPTVAASFDTILPDDIEIAIQATSGYPTVTSRFNVEDAPDDIAFSVAATAGFPTVSAEFRLTEPDDINFTASVQAGYPTVTAKFVNVNEEVYFIDLGTVNTGRSFVSTELILRAPTIESRKLRTRRLDAETGEEDDINRDSDYSPASVAFKNSMAQMLKEVHTSEPGCITEYDPITMRATVQLSLRNVKHDGTLVVKNTIVNVPVLAPQSRAGGFFPPISVGDAVYVLFSERGLDEWKTKPHELSNPTVGRRFDHKDAVILLGFGDTSIVPVDTEAVVMQTRNGMSFVSVSDTGITIQSPRGLPVRLNGERVVVGSDVRALVTETIIDLINNHTHDADGRMVGQIPATGTHVTTKLRAE